MGFLEPDSTNRNFGGGRFHTFSPSMILEVRGGVATQPTEERRSSIPPASIRSGAWPCPSWIASRATSSPVSAAAPRHLGRTCRPRRTGTARAAEPELERGRRPDLAARQAQRQGRLPDAADLPPADEPVRRAALQRRGDARPERHLHHRRSPGLRAARLAHPDPGVRARPGLHRLPHLDPVGLHPGPVGDQAEPDVDLRPALRLRHARGRRTGRFQSGPDLARASG